MTWLKIQKYDSVPRIDKKTRKSKQESLIGEKHENKDIEDKVDKVENCKEAVVIIREFEELIRTNTNNIRWAHTIKEIFLRDLKREREREKERDREREICGIGGEVRSYQIDHFFKISIAKLIDKYPKIKKKHCSH